MSGISCESLSRDFKDIGKGFRASLARSFGVSTVVSDPSATCALEEVLEQTDPSSSVNVNAVIKCAKHGESVHVVRP